MPKKDLIEEEGLEPQKTVAVTNKKSTSTDIEVTLYNRADHDAIVSYGEDEILIPPKARVVALESKLGILPSFVMKV